MKSPVRLRYIAAALLLVLAVLAVRAALRPQPVEVALLVASEGGNVEIRRGAALYFDELNAAGGIDGTPVELVIYEYPVAEPPSGAAPEQMAGWAETVRSAARAAARRVAAGDAWLVIGPGDSISANAVAAELDGADDGPLLAGITSTATAVEVTDGHPGYFRTAPSTEAEGRVLAHYLLRVMGMNQVVVLSDESDDYAFAFADGFTRHFDALGGIADVEVFEESVGREVDALLGNRLFLPDAAVLALPTPTAAAVVAEMRRRGSALPIIGGDSLVGERFIGSMLQEPEERARPGVYSDGVYAASPFLFDTADAAGRRFRQEYLRSFGEEPGWGAATTHDAALVATEAIRSALQQGQSAAGSTASGRAAVLAYLRGLSAAEAAPRGLLGPITFDDEGDPPDRVWITRLHRHKHLSAPVQLVPAGRVAEPGTLPEELGGNVLAVGGRYMRKARVVYTGLDFNQISNFNGLGGYTADFYIWFRYRDVDPEIDGISRRDIVDIEFLELAGSGSVVLADEPLESRVENGMRYELYRVKADFSNAFDFHDYPFDTQSIEISLRNHELTRDRLIYVVDEEGIGDTRRSLSPTTPGREFGEGGSWRIVDVNLFESEAHNPSTLGNPELFTEEGLEYSQLRAVIEMRRDTWGFLVKKFLPVLILMSLAYLVFYMPSDSFGTINATLSGTVVAVALFHFGLTSDLPGVGYAVALDHAFYGIYVVLVVTLLITLIAWRREKDERLVRRLLLTARVVYPLMFVLGAARFAWVYDFSVADAAPQGPVGTVTASAEPVAFGVESTGVLRLASWRTDDREPVQGLLDEFSATPGGFEVRFVPSASENFDRRLRADLASGHAADLMYARGNYRTLFEQGHLVDLTDFVRNPMPPQRSGDPRPPLRFIDETTLAHWSTDGGRVYAVPLMGISQGIYYNRALFDRLDEPYPRRGESWQELLERAQRIAAAGYIPFGNATGESYGEVLIFQSLAPNFIGDTAARNASGCFSDAAMIDALRAYQQLAPFFSADHASMSQRTAEQRFVDGEAAMLWGGSWDLWRYEAAADARDDFDVAVFLPPAPRGRRQVAIAQPDFGIAINTAGDAVAAYELLAWLVRPETIAAMSARVRGFYPLIRAAGDERSGTSDAALSDPFLAAIEGASLTTVARWDLPGNGTPSGRLLLRRALARLLVRLPDDNGVPIASVDPAAEAVEIQRGLATWFEPARQRLACAPTAGPAATDEGR